jgi:hypothetical protein
VLCVARPYVPRYGETESPLPGVERYEPGALAEYLCGIRRPASRQPASAEVTRQLLDALFST